MLRRVVGVLGVLALVTGCVPVKHDPVIVPVAVISQTQPRFPSQAIREAHEGTVVVLVLVGGTGMPLDIKIERSSGYRELDRAAMAAVRDWKFKPKTVDGVPTSAYARVPINFDFGVLRKQIQSNAANRPILQYTPNAAAGSLPPAQN